MKSKIRQAIVAALLCAGAGQASAAGFAIIEHSAQGMGNAFAGGGAVAEDASTMWFNPASMSRMGTQLQSSIHIIIPSFEFTDTGSTAAGTGAPLLSGLGGNTPAPQSNDGGSNAAVPNFYFISEINEQISLGLAINAPFGLKTEYDRNWMGRYQAIDSDIFDLNVNPAFSYKVSDQLSVGAGASINYMRATLTNAIDFAGSCLSKAPGFAAAVGAPAAAVAASCVGAAGGPGQGGNDGSGKVKGDDLSFGFNLGLMYEFNEDNRVSLAYRSEIKQHLNGNATFGVPATISTIGAFNDRLRGAFADDRVSAKVRLPATFSVSGYHRFNNSRFAIMGDATWTDWSTVPGVVFVYNRPTTAGGPTSLPLGFEDTWRLGLGLNYYHNDQLTFRTGVAWDESPVPNAELRTARLPGNDRAWLSFGGSYQLNERMSADFGYSHLFVDDTRINKTTATGGTLAGTYDSSADIVSLQVNYRFD